MDYIDSYYRTHVNIKSSIGKKAVHRNNRRITNYQQDKIIKLRGPDDTSPTPTKEYSDLTTETGTLK